MKNVFVVAGSFDEFRTYVKYQTALTKKKIKYSFVKDICNLYDNKNKDIRYIGSHIYIICLYPFCSYKNQYI
jgi:hypothetical protein